VFLPLLTSDEEGEPQGRLARRWEQSADGREWTFHLRSDIRWHDGTRVTASDVKFTLDLLTHPDVGGYAPDTFHSVDVLDDSTVTVRTGALESAPLWTWVVVYPEHLLKDLDPKQYHNWSFWTHPVGNGPYRLVRLVPNTLIEFEANPDYHRERPKIARVIIKFVGNAGMTELLGGNVDYAGGLTSTQVLKITQDARFRLYHWYNPGILQAVYWRNDHPLFQDARVRRALTLAINRPELRQVLGLPESIPVPDGLYTERQYRHGELREPLSYDPEQAKVLLDEAGWRDVDGDGIRERDGRPFRFTLLVPDFGYSAQQVALYIDDQLRRIGVEAELQPLPNPVARDRLRSGDYEASIATVPVDSRLRDILGGAGRVRYTNRRMTDLVEQAVTASDPDTRDRLYREMTEIYRADLPFLALFPYVTMNATHRRVQGLSSPWRIQAPEIMEDLWLEELR
jgi:peptide/nickel transport system substrate-binding protein